MDTITQTRTFVYDHRGFLTSEAHPEKDGAAYTRGYLTGVTGYATGITYHHPNNLVHTITHQNGVVVTQTNDPNDMARPARIEASVGGVARWSTGSYSYDGVGNITRMGAGYYVYDGVSRLLEAGVPVGRLGTGTLRTQGYTYDAVGNIQEIVGNAVDPGRMTPTSSSTNRLSHGVYDAAGNLTVWNGNEYAYDAFNMMARFTSGAEDWAYIYNADDERIWQFKLFSSPPVSRYTPRDLGGKVLRRYIAEGNTWTVDQDYVYRGESLLATEAGLDTRHFHTDHLNSPRWISNSAGNEVAHHVYYPFGEELSSTAFADQERLKFTSHERDLGNVNSNADDMDYMRARFFSPLTARFGSIDPDPRQIAAEPQSWNKYTYTRNRPLTHIDTTGETAVTFEVFLVSSGGSSAGGTLLATLAGSVTSAGAATVGGAVIVGGGAGFVIGRGVGNIELGGVTVDEIVTDAFVDLILSSNSNDPDEAQENSDNGKNSSQDQKLTK